MRIATAEFPGIKKNEVLFSSYICHPAMANNELSGPLLTVMLINYIRRKKRNLSYRFLLYPETIGSIFYINKNIK
jgi:aminopeptidase-like protein